MVSNLRIKRALELNHVFILLGIDELIGEIDRHSIHLDPKSISVIAIPHRFQTDLIFVSLVENVGLCSPFKTPSIPLYSFRVNCLPQLEGRVSICSKKKEKWRN